MSETEAVLTDWVLRIEERVAMRIKAVDSALEVLNHYTTSIQQDREDLAKVQQVLGRYR